MYTGCLAYLAVIGQIPNDGGLRGFINGHPTCKLVQISVLGQHIARRRIEGLTMTEVDQATGYRIACRKTTTYTQDGERLFKTYLVIELGEDQLLKPIYDSIQKDDELKIDADYNAFKNEFDEHFKNKSQEALEEVINQ